MRFEDADPEVLTQLVTTKMPFGKYKGELIATLPSPYLAWYARHGTAKGRIGVLLLTMYEIDRNGLRPLLTPLLDKARAAKND